MISARNTDSSRPFQRNIEVALTYLIILYPFSLFVQIDRSVSGNNKIHEELLYSFMIITAFVDMFFKVIELPFCNNVWTYLFKDMGVLLHTIKFINLLNVCQSEFNCFSKY